ncbi:hypothetical protein [Massilia sp. BJB1822]|uniref:hypothetical protein n=1 Tax=Massilia sp. BJB1822 TaxID=2744470 RepID=UPI00159342FB|nr:hypothetical protein [Massilia sp. BJB1822]NVE01656.1 hypothetical protein [Massilia sp. BJB1822]
MKQMLFASLLAAGLCGSAAAQTTPPDTAKHQRQELARGDPARWYKEDRGSKAQLATLRKEIGAALNEALADCRQQPAAERRDCLTAARQTYRDDMANLVQLNADAHQPPKIDVTGE